MCLSAYPSDLRLEQSINPFLINVPTSHRDPEQGKAAAAAAAAGGLQIGRPVVKNVKETKATVAAKARVATIQGGMPIIGRPVVAPAPQATKLTKVPGLGDSPQAPTALQNAQGMGQRDVPGQPGQPGGAGMGGQSGRLAGSGSTQPNMAMSQVRGD